MASAFELDNSEKDKPPAGAKTNTRIKSAGPGIKNTVNKECEFPGCSNTVVKPKTGRPPKFCPDHNGGKPAAGGNKSELTGKSWPEATFVEQSLNRMFIMGGASLALINAKDGQIIATGGPAISKALVQLAIDDTSLRKYLMYLTTPGKYGPLILAIAGVALPIAANHGLVPQIAVNITDAANIADTGKG